MREQIIPSGRRRLYTALKLTALVLVVLLSVLVVKPILTSPSTYQSSIDYLNEKKASALKLSQGTASASFIVSMIPDDAGTPIAAELARLSSSILFIISAILLDRYLLTAFGFLSTCVLIPIACLLAAFAVLSRPGNRQKFREYCIRFVVLAICSVLVIPIACFCGQGIENRNRASIDAAMKDAQDMNEIMEAIQASDDSTATTEKKKLSERVLGALSELWDSTKEKYDWAKSVLSNFLSSIAVMAVTTVAIPVIILLFFIWIIRTLTKKEITGSLITMVSGWFSRGKSHEEGQPGRDSDGSLPAPENSSGTSGT